MTHMRRPLLYILSLVLGVGVLVPAFASAATRSLTVGLSGADVSALQAVLISKGYLAAGNSTGYFGQLTLAAVKKYQCDESIVCSGASYGTVGPRTQAALGLTYAGPTQPSTLTGAMTPAATG